jgi:rSAM/selenodomain-associated transferase 1
VNALGVFARAPVAGQVKRRLALDVGAEAAAALYRKIGLQVMHAVTGPAHRTTVWFTPAGAEPALREWFRGVDGVAYRPQTDGDLGARMDQALTRHFADGATRAVLVGTDGPGVDAGVVGQAFGGLEAADLVLGPALDGGYYLIGLTRPAPELFRGIGWSTPGVLAQTEARARSLGLAVSRLGPLRDVDTAADARALGLLNS